MYYKLCTLYPIPYVPFSGPRTGVAPAGFQGLRLTLDNSDTKKAKVIALYVKYKTFNKND